MSAAAAAANAARWSATDFFLAPPSSIDGIGRAPASGGCMLIVGARVLVVALSQPRVDQRLTTVGRANAIELAPRACGRPVLGKKGCSPTHTSAAGRYAASRPRITLSVTAKKYPKPRPYTKMPYFSITPARLAQTTSIVTVGALATTYILYVYVEKLGPAFLPMLSDTFVPAPGNYISRVVLSGAALIIGCIGAAPYYTKRQSILPIGRKALLSMSTVASVCLGVVGAVCEDDNTPSCMGNDKVHSSSAIVFFVLYDVYMIALSFKKPILTDATFTQRYIIFFSLFLSLMSKLRWIPPSAYSWLLAPADPSTYAVTPLSGNASSSRFFKLFAAEEEGEDDYDGSPSKSPVWLACAEYTDVVSIMTWMATYMQIIGSDFEYGLVDQRPDPSSSYYYAAAAGDLLRESEEGWEGRAGRKGRVAPSGK